MRLLKLEDDGQLSLTKDLSNDDIPPYAILSHTWGHDDQELTFQDVTRNIGKQKVGYQKIQFCGKQAISDGVQCFWVDTSCCIDKSNNTKLSEAINSMFRWYQNATRCYVYVSDVSTNGHAQLEEKSPSPKWQSAFRVSRWFTRGWTLQELVAPASVEFFSSKGQRLGDKESMEHQLHAITGIPVSALRGSHPSEFSILERMSWSEGRQTKREEDMAYCLLGIFGVYLPLIYGEGKANAFVRLREEIDKRLGFRLGRPLSHGLTHTEEAGVTGEISVRQVYGISQSISGNINRPPWPSTGRFLEGSAIRDAIATSIPSNDHAIRICHPGISIQPLELSASGYGELPMDLSHKVKSLQQTSPASSFELSPSFRPEIYTIFKSGTMRLVAYSGRQEHITDYTKVNRYEIMYLSKPREWMRLSMTITISVESRYWKYTGLAAGDVPLGWRRPNHLPLCLHSALETILASQLPLEQDSHLVIYLGGHSDLDDIGGLSRLLKNVKKSPTTEEYLWTVTDRLYHLNVPWYLETAVIPHPISRDMQAMSFSFLESRWVLDNRFGSHIPQIDLMLYELRVLNSLRGAPSINPFIGIVVDPETTIAKGFLSELPAHRQLLAMLDEACKSGVIFTCDRCEKWCRQIIQGVAETHAKEFVVGLLGEKLKDGVGINDQDNVVLYRFKTTFYYTKGREALLPPEYNRLASTEGLFPALPQTDIYQLGLYIWRIAAYIETCQPCVSLGEPSDSNGKIDLSVFSDATPDYLRDIISACRTESPRQRPPAWKLLKMFPHHGEDARELSTRIETLNETKPRTSSLHGQYHESPVLGQCFKGWGNLSYCDLCYGSTAKHAFICSVCISGDFRLCPNCMSLGRHCANDEHYLHEIYVGKKKTGTTQVRGH